MNGRRKNLFNEFAKKFIPQIDAEIVHLFERKILTSKGLHRELYRDLKEYCTRPGKRIRPLIFLAGYLKYSRGGKKTRETVKIAAALELMHSFLLIQDDIIDRAVLRRGKPALHVTAAKKYARYSKNASVGNDVALVMADILFALAVELIAEAKFGGTQKDAFLRLFAETYARTAYGQILDVLYSRPKSVPAVDVAGEIISEKTAHYTVVYPLLMGYVLSGGFDKKEIERIHDFALPLGMAFQIRDDILGVYGNSRSTGKSSNSDIKEGKTTMLVAHTIQELKPQDARRFITLLSLSPKNAQLIRRIQNVMKDVGAFENSVHRLDELISLSRVKLNRLGLGGNGISLFEGLIEIIESLGVAGNEK